MKKNLQALTQIVFLALFIFLYSKGRVQLWMGLFLLGILVSLLFGRIYCGWICPINTLMRLTTWVKKTFHIRSLKLPEIFNRNWIRFLSLGLFIGIFIFTMATGKKSPVLPALFALGVILTFFFPEELWHRYLCPFGTILSFPASKAKHSMGINIDMCNNCGACKRVCPAKAVVKENTHHKILKNDCLVCMECSRNCNQNAIYYK